MPDALSPDPDITAPAPDRSQYIRTYAKDVAALTGKGVVPTKEPKEKKHGFLTNQAREPEATLRPTADLVVSSAPSSHPTDLSELANEALGIGLAPKTENEADIEAQIRSGKNNEPSDILQSISLPDLKPGDIVRKPFAVGTNPAAPVLGDGAMEERESILARLRAKVASHKDEAPVVASPTPIPQIVPEPVPLHEATPLPPPPRPVPVFVEPPPAPIPQLKPKQPEREKPSPFHSFSSDFSDRIDEQHASQFSVLAAEKDAKPKTKKESRPRRNLPLLPIAAGIVLIVIGAAGVFAAYRYLIATTPVETMTSLPTLIAVDQKVAISGSGTALLQALAHQAEQGLPTDDVLLTYTTEATTTKDGVTETPATGGDLIAALNLPAPDILLRNIDPSSMVGILNDGSQTRAFFIIRVTSYQGTFAGMLAWEPTIGSDLSLLYPAYPAPTQASLNTATVATSTATTTKATSSAKTTPVVAPAPVITQSAPVFIDEVVSNHDARALKDADGRTILVYGYADQQTLIIARDEAAFTFLLERLQSATNNQ